MSFLTDGFATLVRFYDNSSVKFKEVEVTPPDVVGGGKNDTSTMRNTAWRTSQPKSLKELGSISMVVAYDPAVYNDIVTMVNQNQMITITFPDDSFIGFYGWLDEFKPNSAKEGERPTANITIQCSNQDKAGNEAAPVHSASGVTTTTPYAA